MRWQILVGSEIVATFLSKSHAYEWAKAYSIRYGVCQVCEVK